MKITAAFAVPFAEVMLENAESLNQRLEHCFKKIEAQGDEFRNVHGTPTTQVNIFESRLSLFSRPEPEIQQLREFCLSNIMQFVASVNNYSPADMARIHLKNHTWFHITRKGGYIANHNHPMASWSAVYYVNPGSKNPDFPESGRIRFQSSNPNSTMYADPGNARLREPFTQGVKVFEPKAGKMIIFPSYLLHEVAPFSGDDERICVAINSWFEFK